LHKLTNTFIGSGKRAEQKVDCNHSVVAKERALNNLHISSLSFCSVSAFQKVFHSEAMLRFLRLDTEQKSCASNAQVI